MLLTSEAIADFAIGVSLDEFSQEVLQKTRRRVLDSLGCCLGGYTSPPSKHLRSIYGDRDDSNCATVIGAGTTTPVEYAGLINTAMVRYLDYNDTYISEGRACHPSDHIPALLSVAETEGRTGEEFVEAVVLAYEIEGLGLDTGVTWENGYDYVTWGSYATAVAAGKLMGLSREELVNAIGIAGSSNVTLSVSRKGDVSMWKGIATAYATHNGIQACQMARAGITGPGEVFEGPGGFFEVVANRELEIDRIGGRNGADYRITNSHLKPFPCGYYMQAMIAGVRDLVDEHDVDPDTIDDVTIRTFAEPAELLADPEKWSKDLTRESADHSIPYTVAIAIIYGDVRPEHYRQKYRQEARVHDLMDRVVVEESEQLTEYARSNPDSTPSIVELDVGDRRYETRIDYALGHAENPLSRAELEGKMEAMAGPLLPAEQIDDAIELCEELETVPEVDPLVEALSV